MGADRIQGPAVNSILFLNKADRTVQERMGADRIQGRAVDSIGTVFEQSWPHIVQKRVGADRMTF